jgi:predicted nucleotidyltransferase
MPVSEEIENILKTVVARVAQVEGIAAIVLGGSRARGTADDKSDIDLGIYYEDARRFSIAALGAAASDLDDRHTSGLVTGFGEWGPGVNGGGWLLVGGRQVDLLYRELGAVRAAIDDCIAGRPRSIYQLGHPLGFHIQIYAGEIQVCAPLFDPNRVVADLKTRVSSYPEELRRAILSKHLFDAGFEISLAAKPAHRGDVMYVAGCLFRAAGFMTLVLYALNRKFYLNEKGAFAESRGFAIKPAKFHEGIARILGRLGRTPEELSASVAGFQKLCGEMNQMVAR